MMMMTGKMSRLSFLPNMIHLIGVQAVDMKHKFNTIMAHVNLCTHSATVHSPFLASSRMVLEGCVGMDTRASMHVGDFSLPITC